MKIRRSPMAQRILVSAMRVPQNCRTKLLRAAADIFNSGKKVAMLVGAGALDATDEVIAVAERLQAGVAKALLGKAALPDDLPFVTGSIGFSDQTELGSHEGLRHFFDGRVILSLQRIPSQAGRRERRADRH